jgi:hypothetical protein
VLTIADNRGNIIAPFVVASANIPDIVLFDRTFTNLLELADDLNLDLFGSSMVLDAGFDSEFNKSVIAYANLNSIIKPNVRGLKNQKKIYQILNEFRNNENVYKGRVVIERCFAWEDTYRKLALRYEKLNSTFNGFRYLAYSMINFRWLFGRN